jgi:hypothetical protein
MRGKELVIVLVCLNAAAAVVSVCPGPCLAQELDANQATGISQSVDAASQDSRAVQATQDGDSFGGIIDVVKSTGQVVSTVFGVAFAFPTLLINLGLPSWAVSLVVAPVYIVSGFTLVSFLRGTRL